VTNLTEATGLPAQPAIPILWMDGEIDFLRAHIRFMEKRGFAVERASSLAAALELLRGCPYDLVLLDEQTLGKEGASTLHRIRAACPERIPLLLVTKVDEERAAISERGRDVDGFVGKPVNPVQLLAACRAALLAKADRTNAATSAYVRTRQEIRSSLLASPSPAGWEKIHFKISKWDIAVDASTDAALKDTHARHRRDLNRAFLTYVEDHYSGWVGRQGGNPDLHTHTVRRKLLPLLQRRVPTAMMVFSGLRFDQWMALQAQVEPLFKVENAAAWALLPTEADFCRAALFSGSLPRDVSLDQPQLWARLKGVAAGEGEDGDADVRDADDTLVCMRELMRIQLRKLRAGVEDPRFLHVRTRDECLGLSAALSAQADAPLVVVVVELLNLLRPLSPEACVQVDAGLSEAASRAAVSSVFQECGLAAAFRVLAAQGRSVVLTADHGSVRAESPAEVFCQVEQSAHPRVKIGANISCDERQALFVEAPERFGLPGEAGDTAYAIAKERFYFVYPNKFQYFVTPYRDQMVSGGISPEEVIVPLATLTPLRAPG
jgi:CheY-like chemotaxis protein